MAIIGNNSNIIHTLLLLPRDYNTYITTIIMILLTAMLREGLRVRGHIVISYDI